MTTVINGMRALNATIRKTGRTKNQAFWLTILFMATIQPSSIDLGVGGVEGDLGAAFRNVGALADEQA